MQKSRLRLSLLLSILLHVLFGGLLTFVSPPASTVPPPVAIRVLDAPTPSVAAPTPPRVAEKRPEPPPPAPPKRQPPKPKPKSGGVVAELPEPVRKERPDAARIVSRFDSRAQDIGPGPPAAQKPSGAKPPELPPELALPERYSSLRPNVPKVAPSQPAPQAPPRLPPVTPRQARKAPAPPVRKPPARTPPLRAPRGTVPAPARKAPAPPSTKRRDERQFRISGEQEIAMLQRPNPEAEQARKEAMEEHFARLEQQLPLPTFDAPGVYEKGPERPGEGQQPSGGGKYRSIDAFGLKHFSYLIGVKRKIELVFSVPFFSPNLGGIGVPIVGFTIRRNGELAEAILLRSSGYQVVDQALLNAVKRAAPYGPFPRHLLDREISIRVYATVS